MKTDPNEHCTKYEQCLGWAMVHDLIAHPVMALTCYCNLAVRFHDWTSRKAWRRKHEPSV